MRWWDGQAWTSHTAQPASNHPAGAASGAQASWSPDQHGAVQPASGPTTWKIVVGCVLVLLALVGLSNGADQPFASGAERLGFYLVPILLGGGGVWLIVSGARAGDRPDAGAAASPLWPGAMSDAGGPGEHSPDVAPLPAAGWYRDQHGATRWWDGRRWTTHTAVPQTPSAAPAASRPTTTWRVVVGSVILTAAVVAFPDGGEAPLEIGRHHFAVVIGLGVAAAVGFALVITGARGHRP